MIKDILKFYKGRTVLITGATGFKGSWLSIWLTYLGANVIGFSLPPKTKHDNFVVCGLEKKIKNITGDIRDLKKIYSVIKKYSPSIIFHLAAQSIVIESYKEPLATFETNVMGTVNLLESVRKTKTAEAIVLITSDKCYKIPENGIPIKEDFPLGANDPYSTSKACQELVGMSYQKLIEGIPIASCRAGNVVGGGDWNKYRLIPDCIRALKSRKPIVVRNPDHIRPWQYVLEPLWGYLILGAKLATSPEEFSGPWNFSPLYEKPLTVEEIVKKIISIWGYGSYTVKRDERFYEVPAIFLDPTKAREKLGWKSVLTPDEMLEMTVEEYKIDKMTKNQVFEQRIKHIEKYMDILEKRAK